MKFADITQYTREPAQKTNLPLDILEESLQHYIKNRGLNLEPDYQRGHVWSEHQQTAYVEHILRGGRGSHEFRLNCPGWQTSYKGPFELVDGLQRITALRAFLSNRIPAFGILCRDYEDPIPNRVSVTLMINNLPTRSDVLQWYIDINEGGIIHTPEEINRVRDLLAQETSHQHT